MNPILLTHARVVFPTEVRDNVAILIEGKEVSARYVAIHPAPIDGRH